MVARYDAIIIGAGAAGLMAAGVAGQRGKRILLIDHNDAPGKKILISGGGRCNFTNVDTVPDRFLSRNSHFAKSALGRYSAQDFIDLVNRHGISWHEKTLGQLFCDGRAHQIVDMLIAEMPESVTMRLNAPVSGIAHDGAVYEVGIDGKTHCADALIIATGGPAIPKLGATGFAYSVARQFGLKVVEPRPALVPLTLGTDETLFRELSGVATPTRVSCGKTGFSEASLFTHRGLSGPAILQISTYWRHGMPIAVDFCCADDDPHWLVAAKHAQPKATLKSVLTTRLPTRLATALADRLGSGGELANIPDRALNDASARLAAWSFTPTGTEGFAKAEVTGGGVDTAELSSQTMAARRIVGLYFIGEAVDVTGWLGGYNFQWAWASAVAAANAL